MAIRLKTQGHFSVFFLYRKLEKLRNRVFPVTPPLSIVFVPTIFCAYLWYVSGGSRNAYIYLGRFYPVDTVQACNGGEADVTRMVFYLIFKQNIPLWSSRMERQFDKQHKW